MANFNNDGSAEVHFHGQDLTVAPGQTVAEAYREATGSKVHFEEARDDHGRWTIGAAVGDSKGRTHQARKDGKVVATIRREYPHYVRPGAFDEKEDWSVEHPKVDASKRFPTKKAAFEHVKALD